MRKIILFAFICACLGCSKPATVKPSGSYLIGTWHNTLTGDTTYYSTGAKVFTAQQLQKDLTFTADQPTVDFGNGRLFTITKLTNTRIKLDWHYYTTGTDVIEIWWVEYYEK